MASLAQHKRDCLQFLAKDFEEVHQWLDACFARFGPKHRHARHHRDGIRQAKELFGEAGGTAALIHILRDCMHVPNRIDYENGYVDALGLKKFWSTAAYIKYDDKGFEDLVKEHLKPSGLILWAFLRWEDAQGFLSAVTMYSSEEIAGLEEAWKESKSRLETDFTLTTSRAFIDFREASNVSAESRSYFESVLAKSPKTGEQVGDREFGIGYISIEALTNPLVFIDYELLEDMKPELPGTSAIEVARFAFPEVLAMPITMVGEPTQKTVTFVSRQKTMSVSNVRLRSTPEGTEVSYVIAANASGIVVSEIGDRFVLRNGIHRAFLLAQLGIKEIPCILVKEPGTVPFVASSYPTFAPPILLQPRQPMLTDFMRPELCIQAPIRRTQKVIRISADETMIPVE